MFARLSHMPAKWSKKSGRERERKRVNEKDTQYYRRPGEWQAMKMYAIVITRLGNNRIMAGK